MTKYEYEIVKQMFMAARSNDALSLAAIMIKMGVDGAPQWAIEAIAAPAPLKW